ncbi:hypothetical protein [Thiorhodococcus fuscus]|uniref:Uncharacterized protein n=1 Tax=Thiorhodococcus fuscus TaxID=527200 RepID=A0ABW4YCB0_9GAMM
MLPVHAVDLELDAAGLAVDVEVEGLVADADLLPGDVVATQLSGELAKDRLNVPIMGYRLALAADLEWDLAWVNEDAREAYGEQRWIGFAPIGRAVYCVVFTETNPKEVRDYARHITLRPDL